MSEKRIHTILGILGGLGPLASAEFLKTIYEQSSLVCKREQEMPITLTYSDPTFPDRTEYLLRGDYEELLARLTVALDHLVSLNVSKIVICCMTIHALLPHLPTELSSRIISLFDVIFTRLCEIRQPHLVLCTTGTRRLGLFEQHPEWSHLQAYIRFPDDNDQAAIHQLIYTIKGNSYMLEAEALLNHLAEQYQVNAFIAGCTEMHLLTKQFSSQRGYTFLDPLVIIAQELAHNRL